MKLNLPTTWTSQKAQALFLLTLVGFIQNSETGSQFDACLGNDMYNSLVSFASNIPDKERFCCCPNVPLNPVCPHAGWPDYQNHIYDGQCNGISQVKFCVTTGYSKTFSPANLCGGILGSASFTELQTGNCPAFSAVGNALNIQRTTPTFSWLCCDNDKCLAPSNVAISGVIANTNCPINQWSMMCFNDNGGWTCSGSISININDITQPIGDCVLQVSNSSIISGNYGTTTKTNPIIPATVGTGVGIVSIGSLTYYLIRTKKIKHLLNLLKMIKTKIKIWRRGDNGTDVVEIELPEIIKELEHSEEQSLEEEKNLPSPPPKAHLGNVRINSFAENQQELSYQQLVEQIKLRLDSEGKEILSIFLDAQETFYYSEERAKAGAERQLQRAKTSLGTKISWTEMEMLESLYPQDSEQGYQTQIEVAHSSQTRLV